MTTILFYLVDLYVSKIVETDFIKIHLFFPLIIYSKFWLRRAKLRAQESDIKVLNKIC